MLIRRRLWRLWWGRLRSESNNIGGVVGIVGAVLAFVPFLADKPLQSPFWLTILILGAGIIITLSAVALVQSWPPSIKPVADVLNATVSLEVLETVYPPPPKVGIVGPSYSGKSTLTRGLAALPPSEERTVGVSALVVMIPAYPHGAVALIDGGGQFYSDQFRVAEQADLLILVLDHNQSEEEARLSLPRLKEHRDFGKQLRAHLKRGKQKKYLHVLANKSDVWKTLGATDIANFKAYVESEFQAWQNANLFNKCGLNEHSNKLTVDMGTLTQTIGHNI